MDNENNHELIRRAQNGDKQAFRDIVEEYYDVIYRYALKWCGDQTYAEDITQQSCIKLAKSIHQFKFKAAFSSWLYRLVVNCAKDWLNSQKRHIHTDTRPTCSETLTESNAESSIHLAQVLNWLDTLGAGFRETAVLVLGEGLSHREAAAILEVKESTISWRIHEMRKKLSLLSKDEVTL